MKSYLYRLAQAFTANMTPEQLARETFVFPNRRAGLFFRKYLGQCAQQALFAPDILTINQAFYELSDLKVTDQMELLLRLWRISGQEKFEDFLAWGKMMASDFSEIDNHLVDARAVLTHVNDLKSLDGLDYLDEQQKEAIRQFWGLSDTSVKRSTHNIWEKLYPFYTRLQEELRAEGKAYDGMLHREVIAHWEEIPADRLRAHYTFIGFNALTRSEREMMLRLQDMGKADFYFDYEDMRVQDTDNKASMFKEENSIFRSRFALPPKEGKETVIHLRAVPDDMLQAEQVAQILRTMPMDDATRTCVVLPDEHLLLPILDRMPEEVKRVNVTMGYPLSATPAYALLHHLQLLQRNVRKEKQLFHHKDVMTLMSHPLLADCVAWPEWRDRMAKERLLFVSQEQMGALDDERVSAIFRVVQTGEDALAYMSEVFYLLAKAHEDSALYQLYEASNRLQSLMHLRAEHAQMTPDTVFLMLRMLTEEQSIPYAGEPLKGLQVMGVLETRALDFDRLIITNCNDDLYPGHPRMVSYIPQVIRRAFGMPLPERQDAIFAYNFYRMISYADEVYCITNSQVDDKHSADPSRFIHQLRMQYQVDMDESSVLPQAHIFQYEDVQVKKTEEIMNKLRGLLLSPSTLNRYLNCPLAYYFQQVEGLREKDTLEDDLQATEFGDLFHNMMETLYRPFVGKTLSAEQIRSLREDLKAKMQQAECLKIVHENALIMHVLHRYLSRMLEEDVHHAPLTILGLEECFTYSLPLPKETAGVHEVKLFGKIDRIDRLEDGTIRLIDYKTGGSFDRSVKTIKALFQQPATKTGKRPGYVLQTLLYCLFYEQEVSKKNGKRLMPHLFAIREFKDKQVAKTALYLNGQELIWNEQIKSELIQELQNVVMEMLDVNTPFTVLRTASSHCEYCPFSMLCVQ